MVAQTFSVERDKRARPTAIRTTSVLKQELYTHSAALLRSRCPLWAKYDTGFSAHLHITDQSTTPMNKQGHN